MMNGKLIVEMIDKEIQLAKLQGQYDMLYKMRDDLTDQMDEIETAMNKLLV